MYCKGQAIINGIKHIIIRLYCFSYVNLAYLVDFHISARETQYI